MPLEKLGPYKLGRLLGRGGMGAVYAGRNSETDESAAIKVLSGHLADDAAFRERFAQEIETLKRLRHPNIVELFGFGEEDGNLYYAMEFVEGSTLHDELTAGRRFNWREVARIGIAVATALKHAHDRGIIHRDLKPGNLLLDKEENVKLADFGIAKLYGGANVTAAGGVLGTADYMAPEQADGKSISSRCDLYSLGSVLYALLTGKPPFGGRTVYDVIAALKNEKPVPVRRLAPDTPEEFERIINELLEKEPQDRIPTARALANRLRAMEHALSLETQVFFPGQEPTADESDEAASALTGSEPTPPFARPVQSPATQGDGEYRLAVNFPKLPRSLSQHASARTELRAQAIAPHADSKAEQPSPEPREAIPVTRFTTVSNDEQSARESDDAWPRQWATVGGLFLAMIAIIAAIAFLAKRPPSADRLHASVKAAADEGGPEGLTMVESELTRFLATFPTDERAAEMRGYEAELARFRLQKRLEQRIRRAANLDSLTPIERAYLEAAALIAADPAAALNKFEALLAVFDSPADPELSPAGQRARTQCLELAHQQSAALKPVVERITAEQITALKLQLQRADDLAAQDRPSAIKIWRGIEVLYADKPWASSLVEQARDKLSLNPEH